MRLQRINDCRLSPCNGRRFACGIAWSCKHACHSVTIGRMTTNFDSLDPEVADRPDDWATYDLLFSGLMVPASPLGLGVLRQALADLDRFEKTQGSRKRGRKAADQMRLEASIAALVSEVAHEHLTNPEGALAVTLDKAKVSTASRYRPWFMGKTYINAVHDLAACGWLDKVLGAMNPFGRGKLTTIAAGPRLVETLRDLGAGMADFRRDDSGRELIELRSKKERIYNRSRSVRLEYDDTVTTHRMRDEVRTLNAWIAQADIACTDPRVRTDRMTLYRVFNNGSFDLGGRLYGGFWQTMPKQDRLESLTIEGETVASLDFGQFNPRAAYGVAGLEPTFADAYRIADRPMRDRQQVKTVLNALLSAEKPTTKQPRGLGLRTRDFRNLLFDIERTHAPIRHLFGTGLGLQLQFKESQATMAALLRLKAEGVVALPVHDCLIVGRSKIDRAAQVMSEEAAKALGVAIPVTIEQAPRQAIEPFKDLRRAAKVEGLPIFGLQGLGQVSDPRAGSRRTVQGSLRGLDP